MGYPISNLRTDFQDINEDNYVIIKTYQDKLTSAMTTGDFTEVSNYVKEHSEVIYQVVTDANWKRDITNYVLDLKNYTIATKNQIQFCSSDISSDDFATIDAVLTTNDIVIYLKNTDPTEIDTIEVKQSDGTYLTIFTNVSTKNNIYYYEVSADDIVEIGEANKFDYYVYSTGGTSSIVVRIKATFGNNAYYYMLNNIGSVDNLKDGDLLIIKTLDTGNKTLDFFKIGNQYFTATHDSVSKTNITIDSYKTYVFVYDSQAMAMSNNCGNAGYIVYDTDGTTELSILPNGFQNISYSAKDVFYNYKIIADTGVSGEQLYTGNKNIEDVLHDIIGDSTYRKINSKYTTWNSATFMTYSNIITENSEFPIQYKKKNNWLCIRGQVNINLKNIVSQSTLFQQINNKVKSSGSFDTWLKLFDLPEGYRPSKNTPTVCMGTGSSCYVVYVTTDGGVYLGRRQDNLSGGQVYNFPIDLQIPLDV